MQIVVPVSANTYACLNSSYVYIISEKALGGYRISSEQGIMYIGRGPIEGSIAIVNDSYQWRVYNVNTKEPSVLASGFLVGAKQDSKGSVIGIHFRKGYLLFVRQTGNIHRARVNNDQMTLQVPQSKPQFECGKFLVKQLLPNYQTNLLINSSLVNDNLYLTYKPKNQDSVYFLYNLWFQKYDQAMVSGKRAIINFQNAPLGVFPMGSNQKVVLIQTQKELHCLEAGSLKSYYDYEFNGRLNTHWKKYVYYASAKNVKKGHWVILRVQSKGNSLQFRELLPKNMNGSILQVFSTANDHQDQFYALTDKFQVMLISSDTKGVTSNLLLLQNFGTSIAEAHLNSTPFSNAVLVDKKVGLNTERLVLTQQLVVTKVDKYQHGINLKFARNIVNKDGQFGKTHFTSPLLGTLGLQLTFGHEQIKLTELKGKLDDSQQTLFLKGEHHITPLKYAYQGKTKYINELFEGVCTFANHGAILGNFLMLAYSQQLHCFNINEKCKRSFIYCFDSQISRVTCLNDVNVIGCELWGSSEIEILLINEDKLELQLVKKIPIKADSEPLGFAITYNTVPYSCTLLGGKLVLCSNEELHRYQPDKVIIEIMSIPEYPSNCKVCPVYSHDVKNTTFLLYGQTECRFLNFNSKNLVKSLSQIECQYEAILSLSLSLSLDFNCLVGFRKGDCMILLGEEELLVCGFSSGKIRAEEYPYLRRWINLQINHLQIQNIEQLKLGNSLKTISISPDRALIYNQSELWLCSLTFLTSTTISAKLLSYFGMTNQAVSIFRNNLSINQLNYPDFMSQFSDKLQIVSVKYISSSSIVVLYENIITIVQIGHNQALSVRQQLKFSDYDNVRIMKLLDSYDQKSIYLKDNQSRLFILKCQKDKYRIEFAEDLEEDVICVGRVEAWKERGRKVLLGGMKGKQSLFQRLVIRKDGQLLIGESQKNVYV